MTDEPGTDEVRASDTEREQAVERLREASAEGRLTLEELTQRAEAAYQASTRGELARLTRDLPAPTAPGYLPTPVPPSSPVRDRQARVLAVVGDVVRAGRWWPEEHLAATAVLGDVKLDLREAYLPADGITINATAVLGDVIVLVPEGVRVQMTGIALLGDKKLNVAAVPPGSPAPTVRVHGQAILGDIRVSNTPRRSALGRLFGSG